jgi:ribosomal protein S18 acetylase RimI-like enzyme
MVIIREFQPGDWPACWRVIEPVFRAGHTYAVPPDISEQEAQELWISKPTATYVAVAKNGELLGTYYIKPNQPGNGAHVCNCGYIVADRARGRGIAFRMCEHSQREALVMGFRAMQYNLVVSTNVAAVHLWKRHGFEIVGTLPEAFRQSRLSFVDAFVMFKRLAP